MPSWPGGSVGSGAGTVGRERYADVEEAAQRVLVRAEELRVELEQAVEEDVAAYGSYSRAQSPWRF